MQRNVYRPYPATILLLVGIYTVLAVFPGAFA